MYCLRGSKSVANSIGRIGDQYILGLWSIPLCELSLSFFVQNSFKYILTQGDGLLIAALASLSDQGAYALASNYGGLIARMLFQPIEESSRNLFAKLCAPLQDEKKEQSSKSSIREARTLLQNVLRLYGIITLVACSIGPTLAPTLLRLVAGEKWANTGASAVLVVYCYYIPLLAINGVTEAFVAAVASNSTLHSQSAFMGVCFAVFASVTYLFLNTLQLGASGLVYANCVNMILRIVFNTNFFLKFFREQDEVCDFTFSRVYIDLLINIQNFDAGSTFPNPTSIALSIATAGMLRSEYISTAPKGRYLPVPNSVLMVVSTFSVLL
jgi:oligosaccharide translocation protein RFT1